MDMEKKENIVMGANYCCFFSKLRRMQLGKKLRAVFLPQEAEYPMEYYGRLEL